ncbi:MAG: type II toxin-antitoxin system HicB family antitoxin [Verrucomicrobiales bacterium]
MKSQKGFTPSQTAPRTIDAGAFRPHLHFNAMHLTAEIYREGEWFAAFCPEVPEANGQGRTEEEVLASLRAAIELVFADRRDTPRTGNGSPPLRTLELVDA